MKLIAGVDEVGRGPLAGPVVAAAVILADVHSIDGLADSKKLSKNKRAALDLVIRDQAIAYSLAQASCEEIDKLNILHATMLAMQRAVAALKILPHEVLIDGNHLPDLKVPARAIVGGDALEPSISAASIIAKVERDRYMSELAEQHPYYGWHKNSGYPTKEHLTALVEHGITTHHRRSFAPVAKLL